MGWFKTNHEVINTFVLLLIAIGGVIATIIRFFFLGEQTQSRAELRATLAAAARAEAEAAHISFAASAVELGANRTCYLIVTATVRNDAPLRMRIPFGSAPPALTVLRVVEVEGGMRHRPEAQLPVLAAPAEGGGVNILPWSELDPGESSTYPFLVRVQRDNLYFLQFTAPIQLIREASEEENVRSQTWSARTYSVGCPQS